MVSALVADEVDFAGGVIEHDAVGAYPLAGRYARDGRSHGGI